jgi:hypothetical protein
MAPNSTTVSGRRGWREKGEGRREKEEGRREKGEGRRGRRDIMAYDAQWTLPQIRKVLAWFGPQPNIFENVKSMNFSVLGSTPDFRKTNFITLAGRRGISISTRAYFFIALFDQRWFFPTCSAATCQSYMERYLCTGLFMVRLNFGGRTCTEVAPFTVATVENENVYGPPSSLLPPPSSILPPPSLLPPPSSLLTFPRIQNRICRRGDSFYVTLATGAEIARPTIIELIRVLQQEQICIASPPALEDPYRFRA